RLPAEPSETTRSGRLPSASSRVSADDRTTPASTGPTPVISGRKRAFRCGPYSGSAAMTNSTRLPASGVGSAADAFTAAHHHDRGRHRGDQLGVALAVVGVGLTVG